MPRRPEDLIRGAIEVGTIQTMYQRLVQVIDHPLSSAADVGKVISEDPGLTARLEADAKYAVYLDRQEEDVLRFRRSEALMIPDDFDYGGISGLSNELMQKFQTIRPNNIGQAGRIEGMTPAALTLVAAHARRGGRSVKQARSAR